jgi:hypothetical protein
VSVAYRMGSFFLEMGAGVSRDLADGSFAARQTTIVLRVAKRPVPAGRPVTEAKEGTTDDMAGVVPSAVDFGLRSTLIYAALSSSFSVTPSAAS